MKKQKHLAIAKKPTAKAKKETVRPIPRREKKTVQKPAKGEKAFKPLGKITKGLIKKIGKENPVAGAFLELLQDFGIKPAFIKIETEPESPKPEKKSSKKKAVK